MASDALLSEIERQDKYLSMLPADYEFPLFNARQALESQRRSGYKDTAAASREIVDNAIEAGATRVDVVFDIITQRGGKAVKAIAFIDDGAGMKPEMIRYALSWGGGTHFEDHQFIGRFGFGLPNASINQTRRTEVYSRTSGDQLFWRVVLDIDTFNNFGLQQIPEPAKQPLPEFVRSYLRRRNLPLDHGTVAVWQNPDRLTYKRAVYLKEHLVDDFGVTYRYLLSPDGAETGLRKVELTVEGVRVEAVDPLFLLPGARYVLPADRRGAMLSVERSLPVKYSADPETGEKRLRLIQDPGDIDPAETDATIGTFYFRVARFPIGFAVDKGRKKIETTDAHRRFDIRRNRRGMSFVRSGREIQTVDAFPRSPHDVASGLGRWPLMQGYAYHWGVEVRFRPELNEVFGITNDKQGVRPIEDFWRVLAEAGLDDALHRENNWQATERRKAKPSPPDQAKPSPAEHAAYSADTASGQRPRVPEHQLPAARLAIQERAQELVDSGQASSIAEARKALEREMKRRPYRVAFVDKEYGPLYEPRWSGEQICIDINRRHPFYTEFYSDLLQTPEMNRTKGGLDLLLMALARTELTVDDPEMELWFSAQRRYAWTQFLDLSMRTLAQRLDTGEETEETEPA